MRYVWYVLAFFAAIALFTLQLFHNLPKLTYNLFHKKKKRIYWDPMQEARMGTDYGYDPTESFYHE